MDTPLTESLIVGAAIGAAGYGMRPVAEIQFADFIHPAMDQIINEAAKIRYRSNGAWSCPMVVRAPFGGGVHGALYHSQSVEALFHHVPGLKIVIPSTPYDAKGLFKAAIRDEDPGLVFGARRGLTELWRGEVPEGDYVIPLGKADVKRAGQRPDGHHLRLERAPVPGGGRAAGDREAAFEAEVIDLRHRRGRWTGKPSSRRSRRPGRVMISHEDTKTGGIGAEVSAVIAEEALFYLDAPIRRVAPPTCPDAVQQRP